MSGREGERGNGGDTSTKDKKMPLSKFTPTASVALTLAEANAASLPTYGAGSPSLPPPRSPPSAAPTCSATNMTKVAVAFTRDSTARTDKEQGAPLGMILIYVSDTRGISSKRHTHAYRQKGERGESEK